MKALLLAATVIATFLLSTTPSFAGVSSKKIYEALDVQETDISPANEKEYVLLKKEVGGLVCTQQDFVKMIKKDIFECVITADKFNAGLIYEALLVEEVDVTQPGQIGSKTFERAVNSALVCQKSVSTSQVFYTCKLL